MNWQNTLGPMVVDLLNAFIYKRNLILFIKGGQKEPLLDPGKNGWKKENRTLPISSKWKNITQKSTLLMN